VSCYLIGYTRHAPSCYILVTKRDMDVETLCVCGLQAFFWLRVFPVLKQNPRPPQYPLTKTI
jgi:hypothetical protein